MQSPSELAQFYLIFHELDDHGHVGIAEGSINEGIKNACAMLVSFS